MKKGYAISIAAMMGMALVWLSCGQQGPSAPVAPNKARISLAKTAEGGDPAVLACMREINAQLAARGLNIAVESMEFFTIGQGRPSNRIHHQSFRWVPNDARRLAQGTDITYLVDQSDGATASGLSSAQTESAIDRALNNWAADKAMKKVNIVKRSDTGADPDILDSFFGFGGFGNPYLADIVNAGWLPKAFFDAQVPPNGGDFILAFSTTFIFVSGGAPTDINGDNYLDTALSEVYYNDNFGDPGGTRPLNPWGIDIGLPGIDVESIALHENGHSLGLDHFGPPPVAVMNPGYAGIRQLPFPADRAGMNAIWKSWPNP